MFQFQTIEINKSILHLLYYDSLDLEKHIHCLSHIEKERLRHFKHEKRRKEFVATRLLKHHFFPEQQIYYTGLGAPYFSDEVYISISHCVGVSAIAFNPAHRIGLDLEWMGTKAKQLSSKFLNPLEQQILDTKDEILMTRAWSAKESLYKLAQIKGAIFKENLVICSYSMDTDTYFECEIRDKEVKYSVHLTSKKVDNLIITINSYNLDGH